MPWPLCHHWNRKQLSRIVAVAWLPGLGWQRQQSLPGPPETFIQWSETILEGHYEQPKWKRDKSSCLSLLLKENRGTWWANSTKSFSSSHEKNTKGKQCVVYGEFRGRPKLLSKCYIILTTSSSNHLSSHALTGNSVFTQLRQLLNAKVYV